MTDADRSEHYIRRGDPNKPTYYIIRHMNETAELSAIYRMTAGHIWYALSKGWLPVVDMQNYLNLYLPLEKLGEENSWEYYFEQPLRIGLNQAYNGENVVLSDGFKAERYPDYSKELLEKKDDTLAEWRTLVKWDFLKVKDSLTEEIDGIHEELFLPKEKVLGVFLRGNNSEVEFAANTVAGKFNSWKCDKIFLVTNDSAVEEMFKDRFADKCIILDQSKFEFYDSNTSGKKYLTEMRLLSLCNCLVAERCGDATNVMLMATKFSNTYFFSLD